MRQLVTLLPSMVRRRHQGNALRTCRLGWVRHLDNDIRLGVGKAVLMGKCARDLAVSGLVVYTLDNGLGHRGTTRRQRAVARAHSRGTAAARALGDNFDLVGNGILGAHLVGIGAGDFAMGRLIVHTLNSGDWNRRGGLVTDGSAFRGIREVLVAGLDCMRGQLWEKNQA